MNEENSLCYYFIFYVIKQIRNLTVTISYIDIFKKILAPRLLKVIFHGGMGENPHQNQRRPMHTSRDFSLSQSTLFWFSFVVVNWVNNFNFSSLF